MNQDTDSSRRVRRPRPYGTGPGGPGGYTPYQEPRKDISSLRVLPIQSGSELINSILPETVQLIPLWVIILILSLFVAAVGPLDYFVLGLLKRRYLTWVLFPIVSVGFMVFTVYLSRYYMGGRDYRNGIVFVDVGKEGTVLRTNRYEIVFTASEKTVFTEVRKGIFTPLNYKRFGKIRRPDYYYRYGRTGEIDLPRYEGYIPAHFKVSQEAQQWTIQLNRIFSLEQGKTNLDLKWDAIDPASIKASVNTDRIRKKLLGDKRFDGIILFFNKYQRHVVYGDGRRLFGSRFDMDHFLRDVCVRPQKGFFSVVSQISPTGGDNFEDMALLDPTDPNQWLLVAITRIDEDYIVYRKLYHGGL